MFEKIITRSLIEETTTSTSVCQGSAVTDAKAELCSALQLRPLEVRYHRSSVFSDGAGH